MEFQAKEINGEIIIKPIIERKKNSHGGEDVTIHIPNFQIMHKLKQELIKGKKIKENGIGNIQ